MHATPAHRRTPGRPRTPLLDERRITDAAMDLIGQHGLERFTMARLAGLLGVTPAALYNHASSKQDILRWVEDRLMAMVDIEGLDDEPDWPAALRSWARSYYDVMRRHNALVEAIAKTPVTDAPATLAMYEAVARRLVAEGWPDEAVVPTVVAIESFIYGSAYDAQAPQDLFDTGAPAPHASVFAACVAAHRAAVDPTRAARATFEAGLDALVHGLAADAGVR